MSKRKKYVEVGLGGRSAMFQKAILEEFSETAVMVGYCDNNAGRLEQAVAYAHEKGTELKGYSAENFERMIAQSGLRI